jgi:ADP-ribose pyrophosphatase
VLKWSTSVQSDYSHSDFEILDEALVYRGFHELRRYRLRHRLHAGGWSGLVEREVSMRGTAASAVIYDPGMDAVCMVEQFRVATLQPDSAPWCLEIVAGLIDKPDESPGQVIYREIQEEAGLTPEYLEPITSYWVSPGGSAARMHIFAALCDLSSAGGIYGLDEEHEDILVRVLPRELVYQTALESSRSNAASLIGLQWLTLNRQRMYDIWQRLHPR